MDNGKWHWSNRKCTTRIGNQNRDEKNSVVCLIFCLTFVYCCRSDLLLLWLRAETKGNDVYFGQEESVSEIEDICKLHICGPCLFGIDGHHRLPQRIIYWLIRIKGIEGAIGGNTFDAIGNTRYLISRIWSSDSIACCILCGPSFHVPLSLCLDTALMTSNLIFIFVFDVIEAAEINGQTYLIVTVADACATNCLNSMRSGCVKTNKDTKTNTSCAVRTEKKVHTEWPNLSAEPNKTKSRRNEASTGQSNGKIKSSVVSRTVCSLRSK